MTSMYQCFISEIITISINYYLKIVLSLRIMHTSIKIKFELLSIDTHAVAGKIVTIKEWEYLNKIRMSVSSMSSGVSTYLIVTRILTAENQKLN